MKRKRFGQVYKRKSRFFSIILCNTDSWYTGDVNDSKYQPHKFLLSFSISNEPRGFTFPDC